MEFTSQHLPRRNRQALCKASLLTLAAFLSIGSATSSSSYFQTTHISSSNKEALPPQLDAPLFRDNAVAVDPKSLHVISKVISPAQDNDGSSLSLEGSSTIEQGTLSTAMGSVKNSNTQNDDLQPHSDSAFLASVHGANVEQGEAKRHDRILSVEDMDPSESTAVEFFRSALESFSPFQRSTNDDTILRNDTADVLKPGELPVEEFRLNMAEVPSLHDLRKASKKRANDKTETTNKNNTKRKPTRFFEQIPQNVHNERQPSIKNARRKIQMKNRQQRNQSFLPGVQTPQKNFGMHLPPQATQLTNFQSLHAPKNVAEPPNKRNSARPPVYHTATGSHIVPFATFSSQKQSEQEIKDKAPVYRVRKSTSRSTVANKRKKKAQAHVLQGESPVPRHTNYRVDSRLSPYAAQSAVQPFIQPPLYQAQVPSVNTQMMPYSEPYHPRRKLSEATSYPEMHSALYSDPYMSLQYPSPVPSYTYHFQVPVSPYIPVVSLKDIYPTLSQPSSSSSSVGVWPNVKPPYKEIPAFLRDSANSFETGPVISSAELSESSSNSPPKKSEEKEELPTIINHIHITERRRPDIDREFTIDSGNEGTEWVVHKSDSKNSDIVGSTAKIRVKSRKESRRNDDDEESNALAKDFSEEERVPAYISKRDYMRSSHPLMIGHRLTQALRVADDYNVPEFYMEPVKIRVPSSSRSTEEKPDTNSSDNEGFFSTIMKFFGQSDSQLEKSEPDDVDRQSYKNYKPIYRDRFEELIANLDNDSFDAFLTAIKVNQIFNKSFKRLRRNKGLLNSSTLFRRRSDSIPKENSEELANRLVEDYVSVLFEEYPTIAHQVELNKPFVSPSEGIHRDQFVRPQETINRDNWNEYIGLHNFTENLNDFSNRYSGKTRQWADYMSHLLTEQYFKSVDLSQPVRQNLDLMVKSIKNEERAGDIKWRESSPDSGLFSNVHGSNSKKPQENYDNIKPELLSGEVEVKLGYNGTSGSILHNMLSDILGNFIDFEGTTETPVRKIDQNFVTTTTKSRSVSNRQSPNLDGNSYSKPAFEECSSVDCFYSKFAVQSSHRNEQPQSPTPDENSILLDRLSWIFKENPEQLRAKVLEYIHQKYNSSGNRSSFSGQSNFKSMIPSQGYKFEGNEARDQPSFQVNGDKFQKYETDLTQMSAEDINLVLKYLAQAYPYFWANILGLYPDVQSHVVDPSQYGGVPHFYGGQVDTSRFKNEYLRHTGMNGIPYGDVRAFPHDSRYAVGEEIHGVRVQDFNSPRIPNRPYPAYASGFNLGSGQLRSGGRLSQLRSGGRLSQLRSGGRLSPSMSSWTKPDLASSGAYPMLNTGRVHSLTHSGLQSYTEPASGIDQWVGNRGLKSQGKLKSRLRDIRRKKVKANRETSPSYIFVESLEHEEQDSSYEDYDYDDYEIKIRSEIRKHTNEPIRDSNEETYKNHKTDISSGSKSRRKRKRKYQIDYDHSAENDEGEDRYNYSTEDRKKKRTKSDERTREITADSDSEVKISLIQTIGKAWKSLLKQDLSREMFSSEKESTNSLRRSSTSNSSEIIKTDSKNSNDEKTDSKVIINIGYPFPSTETSTTSSRPKKSEENVEKPKGSPGFLSTLSYLFQSYGKNIREQVKDGITELHEPIDRELTDDEESSEKKIAFSHIDPKNRIHTIVTTSTDVIKDPQLSKELPNTRKSTRLRPIRKKTSRRKNLTRGQRRPAFTDNIHGGSTDVQSVAYENLPTQTKKPFPMVNFEEVSFTETFLGDSSETFQTPKPLDQFDLDPLNPMKPKIMTTMTDSVPKVMTQPGTIYFSGGPVVRYQTDDKAA